VGWHTGGGDEGERSESGRRRSMEAGSVSTGGGAPVEHRCQEVARRTWLGIERLLALTACSGGVRRSESGSGGGRQRQLKRAATVAARAEARARLGRAEGLSAQLYRRGTRGSLVTHAKVAWRRRLACSGGAQQLGRDGLRAGSWPCQCGPGRAFGLDPNR
jgi:hypothetical protein